VARARRLPQPFLSGAPTTVDVQHVSVNEGRVVEPLEGALDAALANLRRWAPTDENAERIARGARGAAYARSQAPAPPSRRHQGEPVPTVIGHHDVKDTEHWLASPKREEVFGPLGVTNIRTFVDPQNPTHVAVLMDVADMDVVMAAMERPEMGEAMAHDGVLPESLVLLVEA
jgi:hypothetical protein